MSAYTTLLTLVAAELAAAPAVVDADAIGRQRRLMLAEGQPQVVNLLLGKAGVQRKLLGGSAPMKSATLLQIECLARCSRATTPDVAVDALWQAVHQRLMESTALADAGFHLDDDLQLEWDQATADDQVAGVQLSYVITHRTPVQLT